MKSGDEAEKTRPDLLVAHIARYGLTLRAVARRLFCDGSGKKTENLFAKLTAQKRIVPFQLSKQPRLSYYRLSAEECTRRGLTPTAGKLSGRDALHAIAVLLFCVHRRNVDRMRVPAALVEGKIGFPLKTLNAPFVVQKRPEQYFGRVIIPGAKARPDYALKIVQTETAHYRRFPASEAWFRTGAFRFVVLTYSPARAAQFTEALDAGRARGIVPAYVRVDVEQVPDILAPRAATQKAGS